MKLRYFIQSIMLLSAFVSNSNGMRAPGQFDPINNTHAIVQDQKATALVKAATDIILQSAQGVFNAAEEAKDGKEIDEKVELAHIAVQVALTEIPAEKQAEVRAFWVDKFYDPIRQHTGDIPTRASFIKERLDELGSEIEIFHMISLFVMLSRYTTVTLMVGDPHEEDGEADDGEGYDGEGEDGEGEDA
jgi:hypothetical protein